MKNSLSILLLFCILFSCIVYAEMDIPPSVTNNVHVLRNIKPSQCPQNFSGSGDDEEVTNVSGYGEQSMTAVGVQSCTGCAYDPRSHDCVCNTCYEYAN